MRKNFAKLEEMTLKYQEVETEGGDQQALASEIENLEMRLVNDCVAFKLNHKQIDRLVGKYKEEQGASEQELERLRRIKQWEVVRDRAKEEIAQETTRPSRNKIDDQEL